MKHAAAAFLLVTVVLAGPVQAQRGSAVTAGKLAEFCASRDKALVAACDAYIDGIEGAVRSMGDHVTELSDRVDGGARDGVMPLVPSVATLDREVTRFLADLTA